MFKNGCNAYTVFIKVNGACNSRMELVLVVLLLLRIIIITMMMMVVIW